MAHQRLTPRTRLEGIAPLGWVALTSIFTVIFVLIHWIVGGLAVSITRVTFMIACVAFMRFARPRSKQVREKVWLTVLGSIGFSWIFGLTVL